MSDNSSRVALVIGGAAGIGLASSRALAASGATVIVADRDGDAARLAAESLRASGGEASDYQIDGASLPQLRSMFESLDKRYGRLNVLFNNVGMRGPDGFDVTEENFDDVFNVNLKSQYFAAIHAIPLLQRCAPHASVIFMSSGAGLKFFGRSPLYAMSKAGIVMMARSFARHLGPMGIRSNALCPGAVDTNFPAQGVDPEKYRATVEHWSKQVPLGRIAQPDDVANLVMFLASDASMYLTGLTLPVDGGLLA